MAKHIIYCVKSKFWLSLFFCIITAVTSSAQTDTSAATTPIGQKDTSATAIANLQTDIAAVCKLGDPAPLLRVGQWIKGEPVLSFEKGKVYVVDFWATWCGPCIAAMPHLSGLARKYKGKVTFSAVSVLEARETTGATTEKLKAFVNGMGRKMDFNVAAEDTAFTVHDWIRDFDMEYIPATFIINAEGRVAWFGNPHGLDTVLRKVLNNTWDINEELSRRAYTDNHVNYLGRLDTSVSSKVRRFQATYSGRNYLGFPDSTLMVIDEMVKKEPKLKYAPTIAKYTFSALLLSDPPRAYEYGKQVMVTPSYEGPAYESIIADIQNDSRHLTPPKEIYLLGAACYQAKIDQFAHYSIYELATYYHEMADWYFKGGNTLKAIEAEKKVIKLWGKQLKDGSK